LSYGAATVSLSVRSCLKVNKELRSDDDADFPSDYPVAQAFVHLAISVLWHLLHNDLLS
jgi:hypothetical protein